MKWLSRCVVLHNFFFHLQNGIDIFMTEGGKTLLRLSDEARVMAPAFIVNVTTNVNE
jgi:hypothetical protein